VELKWLEDFVCLARTNNFSRAAAERNVTQSAFSRRIKALELWLGTPLVDRSTYPTTLTHAGRLFLTIVEGVLDTLYQARDDFRELQRKADDVLIFATQHTLSLTFFPRWLRRLEADTGPIRTQMIADDLHNCMQALTNGDCDFLICYAHPDIPLRLDSSRYVRHRVGRERLVPVSAPNARGKARHALPGRPREPLPLLDYTPDTFLKRAVDLLLARTDRACRLTPHYQSSLAVALKAMALEGHGLAWLPETLIADALADGRLVRGGGEEWDVPLEIHLYRSPERLRPVALKVWDSVLGAPDGASD